MYGGVGALTGAIPSGRPDQRVMRLTARSVGMLEKTCRGLSKTPQRGALHIG